MRFLKLILISIFLYSTTLKSFTQVQSLWSEIRKEKSDLVGLHGLQYKTPLWGNNSTFYPDSLKQDNEWIGVHTFLVNDFNNDGFSDIFLAFMTGGELTPIPFKLLIYNKNTGAYDDQSFRIINNIGQTFNRKTMAADFNGDGILDIVAVSHPECNTCKISYFDIILSNSDTTWIQKRIKETNSFLCEGYFHGVAIGDIDKDGDADIVVADEVCTGGSLTYINDGKGNFIEGQVSSVDRGPNFKTNAWTVELADINNDGCLDMFYWHDTLNTRILYGNCSETFNNAYQDLDSLPYPNVMDYDIRDLDNDEDFDLVLTTTNYTQGWQLVFLENIGTDTNGKIIWKKHTKEITKSLQQQGFYSDEYSKNWVAYINISDINGDGILDIYPQKPFSNIETFNQWILIGNGGWNFKYKKLPFAEPPKSITSSVTDSGKICLEWNKVTQSYSSCDGGIDKWAIYFSDKSWGDRSQALDTIIVSASETLVERNTVRYNFDPIYKHMFVRISSIDSTGIESTLSGILETIISSPVISSVSICNGNDLTINGENFIGVKAITVGGAFVTSFKVLSDKKIVAVLNSGQTGNVSVTTVAGSITSSTVASVISPSQAIAIRGTNSPIRGSIETYYVTPVPGVNFHWYFPEGWDQISSSDSNEVSVKIGIKGGIVTVKPSSVCGNLINLSIPVSVYTYFPDDNFQNALRDLGIDQGDKKDSILSISLVNIPSLNLDSKNIDDFTGIQDFDSLMRLECRSNNLKSLNVSSNKLLEELFCGMNQLNNLDVSKNLNLLTLFCEANQISTLDISKNQKLFSIACGNNPLSSLDISNNKQLAYLSVVNTSISSLDLVNNPELLLMHCWENRLTRLDFSQNLNLIELDCSNNLISSLDFSRNKALTSLICSNNKLVSLNLKNGNNPALNRFWSNNNTSLTCIKVDNPDLAITYTNWKKDERAFYLTDCPVGIEKHFTDKQFKVFPNPASDELCIEISGNIIEVDFEILNSLGQVVCHERVIEKTVISLDGWISGIYYIRFISSGLNRVFRFVKQ